MDTSILRLATSRRIGQRKWDGLSLSINTGYVSFGCAGTTPKLPGQWFMWSFHEHRGGRGGLSVETHRREIKEKARNLIYFNQEWTGTQADSKTAPS